MASAFNLTAQINLRGPTNLKPIVADIKRQLGSISANVNVKLDAKSAKSVDAVTSKLQAMNAVLVQVNQNATNLNSTFSSLSSALGSIKQASSNVSSNMLKTSQSLQQTSKNINIARTEMEEFGKQSYLAIKRFAAFSVVTTGVFALTNAISTGFKAFINFNKEIIRLQQVTGKGSIGIGALEKEITRLATSLGVSSESLTNVATTLAQAGLSAEDTRIALAALAKTDLAPSFDDLASTTEGAIAALRQFNLETKDLEAALGSINAVAAAFAVEASDIITAIQRTGGVFASASKGVSEGKDALNEFIAVFTSVRATTRESAETIATGLRTIFTRIQRAGTIDQLKNFGVELQDLEGKFVGPFEAIKRLSEALNALDPRDVRFSTIVEELGGFRQIGKVIPLIQQFATAQQALRVAQKGQNSLTDAQVIAQQSLANQIAKVREQFLALIRDLGKSTVFQGLFKLVLGLTSGLISLASAFKPILPILAIFTAIKGASAITQFASGFFGSFKKGGGSKQAGENIGSSLTGSKEKERAEATSRAADAIRLNTDALKSLTGAITSLENAIRSKDPGSKLNSGGKVMGFARGGVVPGSGNRDTVPAMLMPGEFVIRKKAVEKLGAGNLQQMNRYASGGKVKDLLSTKKDLSKYYDTENDKDLYSSIKVLRPEGQTSFRQTREQYRDKAEKIWAEAAEEYSISQNLDKANEIIRKKTRINPGLYDAKELALNNTEPQRINRIQGALAEKTTQGQTRGLLKLPNLAGADFVYKNSAGTKFIEVKNKKEVTTDDDLISKALLGYSYIKNQSFKNAQLDNISGLSIELRSTNIGDIAKFKNGGKALGARSKIRELDETELAKLSTSQLIAYAKQQAYDIMTTGGSGMAVASEFIEVPPERIVPELESDLVSYMGKRGFWREKVAPFGKAVVQKASDTSKVGRQAALESQIAKHADEVAAREQRWTDIKEGSDIDSYLLSKLQDPILSDYKTARGGGSLAKTFHSTRLRQAVNKALEDYDDFDYSNSNIDNLVSTMAVKTFNVGGIIQKFMAGGVTQTAGSIPQEILDRIKALGGPGGVKSRAAAEVREAVRASGAGTSGQLLDSRSLTSNPNSAKFAPYLEKVLKVAEAVKAEEEQKKREQLNRNMRAAAGGAYQFGLVSLFGPNGELGYSSVSNAKELTGKNGEQFLTQIVRKSLPERYAQAIKDIQADIAGVPARGAERFQYTDIFGNDGPLAFDFDETLVKNADIPGKNPRDYNDLKKVQEALADAELTLLGRELAKRLIDFPKLMESIRVLTARPQSNDSLLASKLSSLGLPIPASKITGVSGGSNKVENLSELETLIDDNLENIQAVLGAGKRGFLYAEPKGIDPASGASAQSMKVMEGYALEEIVKSLGVNVSSDDADPNRPIDYPKGLGASANIWGIKPTLPTDTKRTNDSSALSRIWGEAQRYFVEKFAFGGKVDGQNFDKVREEIFKKYPQINFRISKRKGGFGYNVLAGLKQQGDNLGNYAEMQQASNLKQLSEVADKMAYQLQYSYGPDIDPSLLKKKRKFAMGGSTEDTVPALLTPGEFVINKKAAKRIGYAKLNKLNHADKIQGYNKGGMVGSIQRFFRGGVADKDVERAQGTVISDVKEAEKTLAMLMGQLGKSIRSSIVNNFRGIEAVGTGQKTSLGTKFSEQTRGQAAFNTQTGASVMGLQIGGKKASATTETVAHETGHLADYALGGKKGFASQTEGTFQFELVNKVKPIMEKAFQKAGKSADQIAKYLASNEELFAEFFAKASPQVRAIITSTTDAQVGMKALADHLGETGYTYAGLEASDISDPWASVKGAMGSKPTPPVSSVPPGSSGPGGGGSSGPGGGSSPGGGAPPSMNTQASQEQAGYFARKAEKVGMSVSGYKYSLAQQVGEQAYNIRQDAKFAKTEAKDIAIGKSRELKGLNVGSGADFKALLGEGATSDQAKKAQAAVAEFSANLQKIAPSMKPDEIRSAAEALAEGLATSNQSVEELIAGNDQLKEIFNTTISEGEALDEAFRRVAEAAGISAENIKANVSPKQIQQQEFIRSQEGQRFGALSQLAPDTLSKFSKTRAGQIVGSGADFVSGKGGALSNIFANKLGGFQGIGGAVAGGAEALKQFLPKSVTSDPDTAGALGALSGAGVGAGIGAQLGSFAGPIGTLIGGVGGAIIGGIQGFFSAKNTAILTNALEKVAKSSGDLDLAFKKLEADSTQVNFDNAQKAFGEMVSAGTDIEAMALGDAASIGGSATSGLAMGGGALGAAIGTAILPGIGTAIGGALGYLGGAAIDYSKGVSQAQKDEAIGAMVGGASQNNQAAARLAEVGLGKKSTEALGAIFDSIKNGTNALNPITEQYVQGALKAAEAANGTKQLTAAQTASITAQAKERAALDAYMKKRKESGATDEQIAKEISKNSAAARKEGEEALRVQAELTVKQALLARATKEVAIATENLLDVYRRINAQAQKYGNELDQLGTDLDNMIAGLGGDTSMRGVNRQNEQVLGNISAYSMEQVRGVANATAGMLGGTPEAQNLADQAVAQKIVQDQIPSLLRSVGGDPDKQDAAIKQIEGLLAGQGIGGAAIEQVIKDLKNELAQGQNLSQDELEAKLSKVFATAGKGLETLQNVLKQYNDTLQKAKDFQEKYNKALLQAASYLRKADQIRLNAELDLARALGHSPTLEALNQPFDTEIGQLTSGLVSTGDLAAQASSDPAAIAAAITTAQQRNVSLEQQQPQIFAAGAGLAEGDPLRAQLNQAQLDNISAIGENNRAIEEGRQALEKLATDGSKAANALSKIQEQQQKIESLAGRLEKIFTADPEELFQMNRRSDALALAQTAGADQFRSRRFRQDAFAGLEQDKEFLTREEYGKQRAMLMRKSFEYQGLTGNSRINKGGIDMTVDEFLQRVEGGISEEDPNVKAYRDAVAQQIAANQALASLNITQADRIREAMSQLEMFLTNSFPDILTQAVIDAKTDSQTKPAAGPTRDSRKDLERATAVRNTKKQELDTINQQIEAEKKKDAPDQARIQQLEKDKTRKEGELKLAEGFVTSYTRSTQAEEKERQARQAEAQNNTRAAINRNRGLVAGRPGQVGAPGAVPQVGAGTLQAPVPPGTPVLPTVAAQTASQTQAATIPSVTSVVAQPQTTASGVDLFTRGRRNAEIKERQASLDRMTGSQTSKQDDIKTKESELAKAQNRLRINTYAAMRAGQDPSKSKYVMDAQAGVDSAQTSLDMARQDLASINEQITTEKQRLAALAEQARLEEQGNQQTGRNVMPAVGVTPAPISGLPTPTPLSSAAFAQYAGTTDNAPMTPQNLDSLRLPTTASTPVPVTKPPLAQGLPSSTPTDQATPKSAEMSGTAIVLDPASLEGLNTFNSNFASYVDRLVTFQFPTIPEKIEMVGNHTVDVRITGAAAFEGLDKRFKEMINKAVDEKMGDIWQKTNGALGTNPGRPTK